MNFTRKRKSTAQPIADGEPQPSDPTPAPITSDLHPKPKPKKTRSPIPSEFDHLSPKQLEYIQDRLLTQPYADVQALIFAEFGIEISINKLFRYYHKLVLARLLEISGTPAEAASQLQKLYNGEPVQIDQAGLEAIQRRALELAISPSTSPSLLFNLMRVFTWEHRKSIDERPSANRRRQIRSPQPPRRNRRTSCHRRRAPGDLRRNNALHFSSATRPISKKQNPPPSGTRPKSPAFSKPNSSVPGPATPLVWVAQASRPQLLPQNPISH